MFSKKATKNDKIFTVDLTLCSKRQIDGEDFVNFRALLRKYELYMKYKNFVKLFINFSSFLPDLDKIIKTT